jgi:hypothetical protein
MRDVAARELCRSLAEQFIHSAIETIDPALIGPSGEREGHQAIRWRAPHGSDIAEASRNGPAANLLGRGFTREMHTFDAEVGGEK